MRCSFRGDLPQISRLLLQRPHRFRKTFEIRLTAVVHGTARFCEDGNLFFVTD
jgi:hypothetical protein